MPSLQPTAEKEIHTLPISPPKKTGPLELNPERIEEDLKRLTVRETGKGTEAEGRGGNKTRGYKRGRKGVAARLGVDLDAGSMDRKVGEAPDTQRGS